MDRVPFGESRLEEYRESLALQERALEELPEATSSNFRGNSTYAPNPMVYMQEGEGATVRDVDGNEYVDFLCGVSALILGHADPDQIAAVEEQLRRGTYFGTTHPLEPEAAGMVNDMVPNADRTKFISTGTEAMLSAMRLARAYTGKDRILKFEGMYHGHNDDSMVSVKPPADSLGTRHDPNAVPSANGIPEAKLDAVETLPFGDADLLERKLQRHGDEIAAVVTEAVASNCGLIRPPEGYLDDVRRLTRDHDVLFVLDEVVTGFRMGLGGAQGEYGIDPDLAIFGKALANGYPNAALTGHAEIMEFLEANPEKAPFSGTFSGNPLVVAATKACLDRLESIGEEGYEEFHARGQRLVEGLREIGADAGHDVFVPEFAGYTFLHFHDGETDPETWTGWREVDRHVQFDQYRAFARAMIGEGVYFIPRVGRINMTHAHEDRHVDAALEAAKTAITHVG